ncbi:MAG: site-specific integrase, partial [Eggerthellaceae bacterium]|nr:site-specific integrase [Eggerthellaceae bacterium]
EKKAVKRIGEEEALRFQQELRDEPKTSKTMAVWIALATGLRRGEVLALKWGAVDLDSACLSVRGQYGKEHKPKKAKTQKSHRTIALDPTTVEMLREWKAEQAAQLAVATDKRKAITQTDETPVCTSRSGGFLEPDTFNRWRRGFYVDHGLGYYEDPEGKTGFVGPDFHSLRRAQGTILVAEGVNPKTVQERLGHERISTTLELYAEAERTKDEEAAEKIGSLFAGEEDPIGTAPKEASAKAIKTIVEQQSPEDWPDWIRQLVENAIDKL